MLQNAVSDQGLHCLHSFNTEISIIHSELIKITNHPAIGNRSVHRVVVKGSIRHKWVNAQTCLYKKKKKKKLSDDILKYFLIFSRKQHLTFNAYCLLWKQFEKCLHEMFLYSGKNDKNINLWSGKFTG